MEETIFNWKEPIEAKNTLAKKYYSYILNKFYEQHSLKDSSLLIEIITELCNKDKLFKAILHIYLEAVAISNYYNDPRTTQLAEIDEHFFLFISHLDYKGLLWITTRLSLDIHFSNHELIEIRLYFKE